jgi:hypothetical protein
MVGQEIPRLERIKPGFREGGKFGKGSLGKFQRNEGYTVLPSGENHPRIRLTPLKGAEVRRTARALRQSLFFGGQNQLPGRRRRGQTRAAAAPADCWFPLEPHGVVDLVLPAQGLRFQPFQQVGANVQCDRHALRDRRDGRCGLFKFGG